MENNSSGAFRKNLEAAILEFGTLACPNLDCYDLIESRQVVNKKNYLRVVYWCRNPKCKYHETNSFMIPVNGERAPNSY